MEHFHVFAVKYQGRNVLSEKRLLERSPKQELEVSFRHPSHGPEFTATFKVVRYAREGELQAGTKTYVLDGTIANCEHISGPVAIQFYEGNKFNALLVRRH